MGAIAEKCLVTFTRSRNEATATGRAGEGKGQRVGWSPLMYEERRRALSFGERDRKRESEGDQIIRQKALAVATSGT